MNLEQAMQEIFYQAFVFTLRPKKCLEALKVIRKTLLDYIELDEKLRAVNEENGELKRMLRLAVDYFEKLANVESCYYPFCGERCPFDCTGGCEEREWKHRDEAMKLLGGEDSVD